MSLIDALLRPAAAVRINNLERVYTAAAGALQPGFPAKLQGLDFLGAPIIADVTGDGSAEVDPDAETLGAARLHDGRRSPGGRVPEVLHRLEPVGHRAPATWTATATPTGHADREGYLFVVVNHRPGLGQHGVVALPTTTSATPAATASTPARRASSATSRGPWPRVTATFTAPGDDWYTGTVTKYVVTYQPSNSTVNVTPSGAAGSTQTYRGPRRHHELLGTRVDDVANSARPRTVTPA